MPTSIRLRAAGASDVGRKRTENEDRILVDAERGIFLVVDGLGGHAAGERAAEIAVEIIQARLSRQTGTLEQRIREAFALANSAILREAERNPELSGMACVATLAVVEDDSITVGHIGDSRCYVLEPGAIRKVTHDHSPIGEQEDSGRLTEDEAMRHPRRNEVFRDLGNGEHGPDDPEFVEIVQLTLPESGALLLCSDGLSDQVTSSDIREIVENNGGDPEHAVHKLIHAANDVGGKDNVSVVLVVTGNYGASQPAIAETASRVVSPWLWFVAGVLITAALAWFLRDWWHKSTTPDLARAPKTITVGSGGETSTSAAMDKAREGDTVIVAAGEYPETLALKSGITVQSQTLQGAKITAITCANVKNARVSGFDVEGPSAIGVAINGCDVEITNMKVSGMSDAAVDITGDAKTTLQASTIVGNPGIGVRVHGTAAPALLHNMITANGRGGDTPLPGVLIEGSANPQLLGNVIANNGAEQVWVSPLYKADSLLQDNVIAPESRNRNKQIKVVTR